MDGRCSGVMGAPLHHHLSHAHIQMARELGMDLDKFSKLANHKQEPWKAPLSVFIENLYFKRFGKRQPDTVRSIEQVVRERRDKKEANRRQDQPPTSQNEGSLD